jgi:hypothetical protein
VGVSAAKPLTVFGVWLVGGLTLGAGLSGLAYSFVVSDGPAPRPAVSVGVRGIPPEPQVTVPAAPAAPAALPSVRPNPDVRELGSATPAAQAARSTPASPVLAASESELSLLKRARQAAQAEPAKALTLTAEHARLFRTGALEQEREMIAIDALLRLGQRAEAAQRAKRFQAQYPGSAHARRLSTLFESFAP